jgi:peptidoglycan hydrolase-like protein with peptidoglycan-binding domain
MKVTKRILREMIENELLNERVGQRIDVRTNKGQIKRLQKQIDNNNQTAFNRQWRNEFMNLDASDFSDDGYGSLLQSTLNAAVEKGWIAGSNNVYNLDTGRSSAGTAVLDDSGSPETPAQTNTPGDIRLLDYLSSGGSVLKFGSSGSKVTALQNILNTRLQSHGKPTIEVTGTFDSATKTAVETMQVEYGLQVDGIVGRQTWVALKTDGAERAAVTPRAERAPADGAATAEEEAAAAAAAAAQPSERPEKPGPMFVWDSQKLVWYAYHNHYYKDENPQDSIYQLWIVKGDEDFHVKMETGDTWANVTQNDIDSLETQAEMDAVAAEVDVIAPDPDEADDAVVGADEVEVEDLALENRSYSLARVMLLEFSAAATRTDNHPENTERDEVGRGDPIFTLEEQEAVITARLQAFNNDIQGYGRVLAKEGNKGRFTNSDEEAALQALAAFNQVAEGLYAELSDKVAEFKRAGGDITRLKTPSQLLALSTGWGTVDNMIEKLDSFLAREEYGSMMITVKRNNFSLIEKAREVVASADPGADPEEITRVNNELDVMMQAIKPVALIIAVNSYDPNSGFGWRAAQVAAAAAVAATIVFTGGAAAGAYGAAGAGAAGASAVGAGATGAAAASGMAGVPILGSIAAAGASTGAGAAVGAMSATGIAATVGGGLTGAAGGAGLAMGVGGVGLGAAAGGAALGAGLSGVAKASSFLGDGADEGAVMDSLELFSSIALQFYQNNAKSIIDNQISVKTPSQYLLDIYNRNVNEDDVASTIDGLADQMDEFLGGGNYDDMVTILGQNNVPYRQFSSALNESFTFDRFSKLAGLLKG